MPKAMLVFEQSGPTKLKTTKAHKERDGFMSNRIPFGQARIRAALQCADAAVEAMTIFGPVCLSQKSALHPMQRLLSSRTNPSESLRTALEEAYLLAHGVVAMVAPARKAIGGKASVPLFVERARRHPPRPHRRRARAATHPSLRKFYGGPPTVRDGGHPDGPLRASRVPCNVNCR